MEHAPKLAEEVNMYAADLVSNLPPPVSPPTTISPFYAIADSRCTVHFFSSTTPECNKWQTNTPLTIHMPSGPSFTPQTKLNWFVQACHQLHGMAIWSCNWPCSHCCQLANYVMPVVTLHSPQPLSPFVTTTRS